MPVVIVPGSAHAEEVLKWEYVDFRIGDDCGKRGPRVFVEFPKMLYRADRNDRNQINVVDQQIADDADHQRRLESRGYHVSQEGALDACTAREREIAKLAANRAHHERGMSEKARAEAAQVDDETPGHVASIPEAPRKRGRPAKVMTDA